MHNFLMYLGQVEMEMPCVVSMAYMELSGMGFSSKECQAQKSLLQVRMKCDMYTVCQMFSNEELSENEVLDTSTV